jgi:hypothetical protein
MGDRLRTVLRIHPLDLISTYFPSIETYPWVAQSDHVMLTENYHAPKPRLMSGLSDNTSCLSQGGDLKKQDRTPCYRLIQSVNLHHDLKEVLARIPILPGLHAGSIIPGSQSNHTSIFAFCDPIVIILLVL